METTTTRDFSISSLQRQQSWDDTLERIKHSCTERCSHETFHKDFLERLNRTIISCQTNRLINRTVQLEKKIVKSRDRLLCCAHARGRPRRIDVVIGMFLGGGGGGRGANTVACVFSWSNYKISQFPTLFSGRKVCSLLNHRATIRSLDS